MIDVRGYHFTILMNEDCSQDICEQYHRGDPEPETFSYKDGYELCEKFLVDGIPLGDLWDEVYFYDYTQAIYDEEDE